MKRGADKSKIWGAWVVQCCWNIFLVVGVAVGNGVDLYVVCGAVGRRASC